MAIKNLRCQGARWAVLCPLSWYANRIYFSTSRPLLEAVLKFAVVRGHEYTCRPAQVLRTLLRRTDRWPNLTAFPNPCSAPIRKAF